MPPKDKTVEKARKVLDFTNSHDPALEYSAIMDVIRHWRTQSHRRNGESPTDSEAYKYDIPQNGEEWKQALSHFGISQAGLFSFSDAPGHSTLEEPRELMAVFDRPVSDPQQVNTQSLEAKLFIGIIHSGSFGVRAAKAVDKVFEELGTDAVKTKDAFNAINQVLGTSLDADKYLSLNNKEEKKKFLDETKLALISAMRAKYPDAPDKLAAFLHDVQDKNMGLLSDNPLKTHKSPLVEDDSIRQLEFVSRNRQTNELNYGIINYGNGEDQKAEDKKPEDKTIFMPPKQQCATCHITPIYPQRPWSNTNANELNTFKLLEKLFPDDPVVVKKLPEIAELMKSDKRSKSLQNMLEEEFGKHSPHPKKYHGAFVVASQGGDDSADIVNIDILVRKAADEEAIRDYVKNLPDDVRGKAATLLLKEGIAGDISGTLSFNARGSNPLNDRPSTGSNVLDNAFSEFKALRTVLKLDPKVQERITGTNKRFYNSGNLLDYNVARGKVTEGIGLQTDFPGLEENLAQIEAHNEARQKKNPSLPPGKRPSEDLAYIQDFDPNFNQNLHNKPPDLKRDNFASSGSGVTGGHVSVSDIVGLTRNDFMFLIGRTGGALEKIAADEFKVAKEKSAPNFVSLAKMVGMPTALDKIDPVAIREKLAARGLMAEIRPDLKEIDPLVIRERLAAELIEKVLKSDRLDELTKDGSLPNREEVMATLVIGIKEEARKQYGIEIAISPDDYIDKNMRKAPPLKAILARDRPLVTAGQKNQALHAPQMNSCFTCHTTDKDVGGALPLTEESRQKLFMSDREEALRLQEVMIERIRDKSMPPKKSDEGKNMTDDQRNAAVEWLKPQGLSNEDRNGARNAGKALLEFLSEPKKFGNKVVVTPVVTHTKPAVKGAALPGQ